MPVAGELLVPRPTDRAVFVGQTGSGKTTLAEHLLRTRRYVVAYDPKGMLKWPGFKRYTSLDGLAKATHPWLIYAPSFDELQDEDAVDAFFEWVYRRRHTTVYVDEYYAITNGDRYPYYFGGCLTRGRERNIEMWGATQRPARVPQIVFSEAEHVYCFRLRMPQDRERVESMTGIDEADIAALAKRQFIYAPQEGDIAGPLTLQLQRR